MLNDVHIKYFESIGIDPETAINAGVYSEGQEICYPTYISETVVNLKYRGRGKKFRQAPDGQQAFYNGNAIDLAIQEKMPLLIVEGENDALSALESRYAWTVSVPCGAPAKEMEFYSIEEDNKFQFLWNDMSKLKQIPKFILAGDADEPGRVLNNELVKRLGAENCKFIEYPDGCKDLNDVLVKHDATKVVELINRAKDYPVVGLYRPDEFPPMPKEQKVPYSTGYGYEHDHHLKLMLGKFMVVSGYPGHGKSEWTDGLVLNLAKKYGWRVCVCSTEIDNEEYQENTIRRYLRRPLDRVGEHEPQKALDWYNNHYRFISNATMDDLELSLEKLIELAEIAILRDDCRVVLLDPWNEIEHCRKGNESETEYTGRAIRMLKKLAKQYGVLVIVVAHPAKPETKGKIQTPNLYSISGSANWANKADYGVMLHREDLEGRSTTVSVVKVKRHGAMGYLGDITVELDDHTKSFKET